MQNKSKKEREENVHKHLTIETIKSLLSHFLNHHSSHGVELLSLHQSDEEQKKAIPMIVFLFLLWFHSKGTRVPIE